MTAPDLAPCPFCGGSASIYADDRGEDKSDEVWVISCDECPCEMVGDRNDNPSPHFPDEKVETIAAWGKCKVEDKADEWRCIETAPTGERILAKCEAEGAKDYIFITEYRPSMTSGSGFGVIDSCCGYYEDMAPTHWKELK